jgi:hypothetical protein
VILWRSAGPNLPTRTCIDCTSSWSPSILAQQLVPYVCFSVASGALPPGKSGASSPRITRFVTRVTEREIVVLRIFHTREDR